MDTNVQMFTQFCFCRSGLNSVNQSVAQVKIALSLQWPETELSSNSSVHLYLTLSRCVNILQVFEKCPSHLMLQRVAQTSSSKTFRTLSDVRGGCHCQYPGCPSICGPTLTSVLSVFILSTNSAWDQDTIWLHISLKQCYLPFRASLLASSGQVQFQTYSKGEAWAEVKFRADVAQILVANQISVCQNLQEIFTAGKVLVYIFSRTFVKATFL